MKVGVVYHFLPHYRKAVFRELALSKEHSFVFISGLNNLNDVSAIDPSIKDLPIVDGGLKWYLVRNYWFLKKRILFQTGLFKHVFSKEFDAFIFLGNPYFISTWLASFFLAVNRVPFYFWTHGVTSDDNWALNFLRKTFYSLPTGLFLYGSYARNKLITKGFSIERLHVIYNSLDVNAQIKLRNSLGREDFDKRELGFFKNSSLPILLFIGRLTKQKKLNILLEAVQLINDGSFRVNLLFVGDGSERNKLEEFVLSKKLEDCVYFYGPNYDEEINCKLISVSDICVSPGEVGLTAMHALSYGTPVITHSNFDNQMPEFEAIRPGYSGDFFRENDSRDLASKILNWLEANKDREIVRRRCVGIINKFYNPNYQKSIICEVLSNEEKNIMK